MSRPTEIMLVAIAQSTRSGWSNALLEAASRLGHLVGRDAGGELDDLGERPAVAEQRTRLADPPALAVA